MKKQSGIASKNRRINQRHVIPYLCSTDEGWGVEERLNNISLSGCSITTPQVYEEGEHVLLHFKEPEYNPLAERTFCLDGFIVWSSADEENRYTYGMYFQPNGGDFLQREMITFQRSFTDLVRSVRDN
jgi:hypothetical protein